MGLGGHLFYVCLKKIVARGDIINPPFAFGHIFTPNVQRNFFIV